MRWVRRRRVQRLRAPLEDQAEFYGRAWTDEERDAWQLDAFNRLWKDSSHRTSRWTALRRNGGAPAEFTSWEQFRKVIPVTMRADLQEDLSSYLDTDRPPEDWRATGGSTGQPLRTPLWRSETTIHSEDFWFARSWFSVAPDDRLFLFWGHAHLLGQGLRGRAVGLRRQIQDRLLGYRRQSAYDMSADAMRAAAREMLAFRPDWVLGYAHALDRFADVNRDVASALRELGLKVAIATAESFPRADSADLVARVLGCQVAMEYGAVETGPLAHTRPDGTYAVFWRHYRLEGVESSEVDGARELLVTSLYPRCLPLVRYRIGDLVRPCSVAPVSLAFREVVGRCNESLVLANGERVHSEAFAHALRGIEEVHAYQLVQTDETSGALLYCGTPLGQASEAEVRRRLSRISSALGDMAIEYRQSLTQTVAGKSQRFRREN